MACVWRCHTDLPNFGRSGYTGSVPQDRAFVTTNVEGPVRPLSTGALFPSGIDVLIYPMSAGRAGVLADERNNKVLTLHLRAIDGQPVLVGISASNLDGSPRELSAAELHMLPVKALTEGAVRAAAATTAAAVPHPYERDPIVEGQSAVNARRRHVLTDELLQEVASVVKSDTRGEPRQAVRKHFSTSLRTASRWLAAARDRGFLATDDNKEAGS